MLAPLIQRAGRSVNKRTRERGVTMALVAISMVAIISFAALAIDLGSLYEAKSEAQRSADAAALTAAQVVSLSGITGDPSNGDANWSSICGPSGTATVAAQAVGNQNLIGGKAPSTITVLYGPGGSVPGASDCGTLGSSFGINPTVSVYVQQASMPTFFARVFGLVGGSGSNSGVSATAYAEAFNPSDSNSGAPTPVQPRCVKPWVIPNLDPRHTTGLGTFVTTGTGQITKPGMFTGASNGVIGERFFLLPDCTSGKSACDLLPGGNPPSVNGTGVYYVPGQASAVAPVALPTTGTTCSSVLSSYAQDIAGCDQSTIYECGVPRPFNNDYSVDLSENPATNDTQDAVQCLINQSNSDITSASGQDTLGAYTHGTPPTYPFQIQAGFGDPLVTTGGITSGSVITNSASIVSLPIYDNTNPVNLNTTGTTNVTIVGFLQVFINGTTSTPPQGVDVTVLNVTGCGNTASTTTPVAQGTSPVPVRLITPP
jgi:type II secretory pathway pseudopilin PulG